LGDAHRFVCRADARRTYEVGGTLTGFEFGTRKTKTFSARLYDKTADVEAKGTRWWLEVWGDRYRPGAPVHRMEFEIGRQGLVEFDLDTPDQVLQAAGDLWAYATGQWLTHRSPTADQTRSRWSISPEWQQVQRATLCHRAIGLERLRFPTHNLHRPAAPRPHGLHGVSRRSHRHGGHRGHSRPSEASTQLRGHQPNLVCRPDRPPAE